MTDVEHEENTALLDYYRVKFAQKENKTRSHKAFSISKKLDKQSSVASSSGNFQYGFGKEEL